MKIEFVLLIGVGLGTLLGFWIGLLVCPTLIKKETKK